MKLEAGKTYRTRDGRKARCVCDDRICDNGITCVVMLTDLSGTIEEPQYYYSSGEYAYSWMNQHDIIAEWTDEPAQEWVDMEIDGDTAEIECPPDGELWDVWAVTTRYDFLGYVSDRGERMSDVVMFRDSIGKLVADEPAGRAFETVRAVAVRFAR